MNRSFLKILLILLGVLIGIEAQRILYAMRKVPIVWEHPMGALDGGIADNKHQILEKLREAFRRGDSRTINELLQISPSEIELEVRVCPVYPDGFAPVARLAIRNVSAHPIIIPGPTVKRLTEPSYSDHGGLRDDFAVICSGTGSSGDYHLIEAHQIYYLPLTDLMLEGIGPHEVKFSLDVPIYEFVSEQKVKAKFLKVSEATVAFTCVGPK